MAMQPLPPWKEQAVKRQKMTEPGSRCFGLMLSVGLLLGAVPGVYAQSPTILNMNRLPDTPSGPVLNLEQLSPASSANILSLPAGFHAPDAHTPAAELTRYAQWLTAIQSPEVSDVQVFAQLTQWINEPAPVALLQQRIGLLLRLGLVPWAVGAAQRLPNDAMALQLGRHALMWQLLYPTPWSEPQQQAYLAEWRPAMQAWLVNQSPQPMYAVWAKFLPTLVEPDPKHPRRSPSQPTVYRVVTTVAHWMSTWGKAGIAQQFSYLNMNNPKLAPLPESLQRYMLTVWPEWIRTVAAAESAYRLVDERLVQVPLSSMARVQQREALLAPLASLHQKVRQCQARVARQSTQQLPSEWQDAHGALVQWCKAQHWGLDHLRTAVSTPPFMDMRPALPETATVLDTLSSANTELTDAWSKALAETPEWTLQQLLLEAGHAPDVMRQLGSVQTVVQPIAQSVWTSLSAAPEADDADYPDAKAKAKSSKVTPTSAK